MPSGDNLRLSAIVCNKELHVMNISVPENLETPLAMMMKGVPEDLQASEQFKDAALVYLKLGGINLARQYVETQKKYIDYDPLEIDTGFRFPRLQEVSSEKDIDADTRDDEDDDLQEKEDLSSP